MSKRFTIDVPVTVRVTVEVIADSEREAIDIIEEEGFEIKAESHETPGTNTEVVDWEWEMHEQVTQGNVYYGVINRMTVVEEEDMDDE